MLCGAAVVVGKEFKRGAPSPTQLGRLPNPGTRLGAGKTRTATPCSGLTLSDAFDYAFNDSLSLLLLNTTHLSNFRCLPQLSPMPTAPSILDQSCKHEKEKQRKGTWQFRADRPVHFATACLAEREAGRTSATRRNLPAEYGLLRSEARPGS